jgi:hypothetical protein
VVVVAQVVLEQAHLPLLRTVFLLQLELAVLVA